MKLAYKFSILASSLLLLSSCNNDKEPLSNNVDNGKEQEFLISGDFQEPEMVDLGDNNSTRAFVLRENEQKYPKVVLTELENNALYEPYFSRVYLHNTIKKRINRTFFVEDMGGDHAHEASTPLGTDGSAPSRATQRATQKGASRILKIGDKYRVFIRFSSSNGDPKNGWLNPYDPSVDYKFQVALNPLTNGGANWPGDSDHRIYVPMLYNSDNDPSPASVQMPALKLVNGDYRIGDKSSDLVIANQQNPGAGDKMFTIPVISDYRKVIRTENENFARVELEFKMRGALLSMNLQNKIGKNIILKKLKTRSNNLAYVGFYDMWHLKNTDDVTAKGAPLFLRASGNRDAFRTHIYTYDLQNEAGQSGINISANSTANGRLYLWGAIDTDTANSPQSTKVQFVYAYADAPDVEYVSETLELTPKVAPNKFEEGKVYLVNVPIGKALNNGSYSFDTYTKGPTW